MGAITNAYTILVENPLREETVGPPRPRQENNIRRILKE
jgi:hypothetical protein